MLRSKLIYVSLLFLLLSGTSESFKDKQLTYSRVRTAYTEKESEIQKILDNNNLVIDELEIYLRAFKHEKIIELWAKNREDNSYRLIREYEICRTSGRSGPKRKQGDRQIPEGFYHINRYNPYSNFHLSLGINYPNKSDRILGEPGNLGGDIFIHGACVTIGCMPITDDKIKELYVFCVEARSNGQLKIPVTIFPAKLEDAKYNRLVLGHESDTDKTNLWSDLKESYDLFNETKTLPTVVFLSNGRHKLQQ